MFNVHHKIFKLNKYHVCSKKGFFIYLFCLLPCSGDNNRKLFSYMGVIMEALIYEKIILYNEKCYWK